MSPRSSRVSSSHNPPPPRPFSAGATTIALVVAAVVVTIFVAAIIGIAFGCKRKTLLHKDDNGTRHQPLVNFANLPLHSENTNNYNALAVEPPCRVRVVHASQPRVVVLDNFLSAAECAHLIALAEPLFRRSPVQGERGGDAVSEQRTSSTANLRRHHDDVVRAIEHRAARVAAQPLCTLESLQVVRYEPGQRYNPHYDYFAEDAAGSDAALRRGGQRTTTLFAYLNDAPAEAATRFPRLGLLRVVPRRGSAAMWHNVRADGAVEPLTFHGGDPPLSGIKYGLNIWFRERAFS